MRRKSLRSIRLVGPMAMMTSFLKQTLRKSFLKISIISKAVEDGQERQVFVFAHNMRRFDRMFIQDTLYGQGCRLEKILSRG